MPSFKDIFDKSTERLKQQAEIESVRDRVRAKFPLLGTTMAKTKTLPNDAVGTAGTDGKNICYSPKYFETLADGEKDFVYAHELFHIAFNHILRSKDRDHKLWNRATDAVINQILKNESLPMADGGVDIADAINHSAEEMYEKLLEEKEQKEQEKQNQQGEPPSSTDSGAPSKGDNEDENEQAGHDNHEIWKDAVKQHEKEQNKKSQQPKQKSKDSEQKNEESEQTSDGNSQMPDSDNAPHQPDGNQNQSQDIADGSGDNDGRQFDNWQPANESEFEKGFAEQNTAEKSARAAVMRDAINREANLMSDRIADSARTFGDVGKSDAALDWKRVLKKTIETEQSKWSYRRSDVDNDFMARVEDMDEEDKGETEVLMDTSGSVSDSFLREFLRQLKPLLQHSKLRVGCFDHRFHPFIEIKSNKDIDNFKIPNKGNTDWDLAVKSFTKKKHINKIVFTDGETPGRMPDAGTKNINVIWLVYGDEQFNPICGKVIRVAPKTITRNHALDNTPRQIATGIKNNNR